MASGTINGRTGNSDVYAKIEWSYTQNINTNKSTVTATVYIRRLDDGTWTSYGSTNITLTIAGTSKTESKYFSVGHMGTSDWYQMITNTVDVAHNADGTHADITISCTSSGSGTTVEPITCSGTVALPPIARASQPSTSNGTFGSAITINTNRASSSFTHTLVMTMGSHSETKTSVGASLSWTCPASWADTIPTATSNTLSISCTTYSGSTNIGTKTTSCTMTIPDSWKPTVSITKTLTNGGDSNQVIVNVTTVNLTASGTAPTGTTINSYTWSGGTVSGTGASKTHSPTSAGTFTYTVTVADKRGRTGTATVSATSVSGVASMSCASSINFGANLAVTITSIKSSFRFDVDYRISSSYYYTQTDQLTSTNYTIPTSWAASVPTASSITMTVKVTTKNNSTSLGSVSKTVSVVVPSSWVPAFTLTTEAVSAFNSLYLKGVSKVKLTASSASASTGSQIKSYSFSGNNVNKTATTTATSYNVTSDLLSVVGSNTYTVKVTDKRGRVTTKTSTITVTDYKAPTLKLSVGRYTSGGVSDNFGSYGRMTATGTWSNVTGNKWTLTLKQKTRSASSYTTVNTYSNQTTASISKTSDLFSASVDNVYDCQATLTDTVGKSVTKTVAISTGQAVRDIFKDKVVSFFSTASEALRQTFGSPSTLFFSNATKNVLNNSTFIPDRLSLDGLTDGWFYLNDVSSACLCGSTQSVSGTHAITSGSNLNSFVYPGTYFVAGNSIAGNVSNLPISVAGTLFVRSGTGSTGGYTAYSYIRQEYHIYSQNSTTAHDYFYVRYGETGNTTTYTWTEWRKFYEVPARGVGVSVSSKHANVNSVERCSCFYCGNMVFGSVVVMLKSSGSISTGANLVILDLPRNFTSTTDIIGSQGNNICWFYAKGGTKTICTNTSITCSGQSMFIPVSALMYD